MGGRLAALTIWGKAASGGRYAAIAALTNIPATLIAIFFYQLLLGDTSRRKFSEPRFLRMDRPTEPFLL